MNKRILDNQTIKKELLYDNGFKFSLFWMCIPAVIFFVILAVGIYCFINGDIDAGVKSLGGLLIPIIVALILGTVVGVKQEYIDYKDIKRDLFEVKMATCVGTKKQEYDSDGIGYEYTWIFENDVKIVRNDSNIDLFDKHGKEGDYLVVYLQNNKQPKLFFSTEQFEFLGD